MACQLVNAMTDAGNDVSVLSHLRAFIRSADDWAGWRRLQSDAKEERDRIAALWQCDTPDLVFCYHPYYKSPDLIGLPLARQFGLPYLTCEASYSARRNIGVWTEMQSHAQAAVRSAAINICLSQRDAAGLAEAIGDARIERLAPFIDTAPFSARPQPEPAHIVAVAMMRPGDKLESYRHMAASLTRLPAVRDWRLSVVGDGDARNEVQAQFTSFPAGRLRWMGALSPPEVAAFLRRGAVYLWPGIGEAYGLAFLEAQAAGLPVVAFRTAGVPEVVHEKAGGTLVAAGDTDALAAAVSSLLADPAQARQRGLLARDHVNACHSLPAATSRLAEILELAMQNAMRP